MTRPRIIDTREQYCTIRLGELKSRIAKIGPESRPPNLTIFCAGSYARHEASQYSDIDLFFVYGPSVPVPADVRTREIKLFAELISIAENMQFPEFSNDGEYLKTMRCDDILKHLGAREDDFQNHFTMRMVLLLESRVLLEPAIFEKVQRELIAAYYRDYPDHQASFEPWFLINDIGRFWKTLLLNYENKRNQATNDPVQKNKQKVRNFKLKYSRMTTCFATVAALASYPETLKEDHVYDLVQLTPQARLMAVADQLPTVRHEVRAVQDDYAWFLEQTAKTEEALRSGFEDQRRRTERFKRANTYGDKMFALLQAIAQQSPRNGSDKILRYLVI